MSVICEKLLDYNLVDVEGLVLLDKEFNMIEDQFEQAWLVMAPPQDGIFTSKLHDHDILREFRNKLVFDTKYQDYDRIYKSSKIEIGDKFKINEHYVGLKLQEIGQKGGYVPDPPGPGVYEWIAVIDFNKYYPNAIMSANAGIRTAIDFDHFEDGYVVDRFGVKWLRSEVIETPVGIFRKDIDSVNRYKFKKWLARRKEFQNVADDYLAKHKDTEDPMFKKLDTKQFRAKNFTNGGFGVFGLPSDRNYSKLAFNSCTMMCQDLIMKTIEIMEKHGYSIVGGDTDSIFLQLRSREIQSALSEAKEVANKINAELDVYLDEVYNIQEHSMNIAVETISDKFWIRGKKNYVKRNLWTDGVLLDRPQLEIKGIDMKKRGTSKFSADMQSVMIDILLNSQQVEEDMRILINTCNDNFESFSWDYVAPKGAINMELSKYKEGNSNARGARNAFEYFNKAFMPGDNPYIMPFEDYPASINGKFVGRSGTFLMLSFDEEDVEEIQRAKFVPNFKELRRTQIYLKSKSFLELFGLDYYDIIAQKPMGDDMEF